MVTLEHHTMAHRNNSELTKIELLLMKKPINSSSVIELCSKAAETDPLETHSIVTRNNYALTKVEHLLNQKPINSAKSHRMKPQSSRNGSF